MSKNENLSLGVFDNPEFGQTRILREGDKYLFCANDAAVALGYSNPRAALQRHCKGVAKRDTLGSCPFYILPLSLSKLSTYVPHAQVLHGRV